MLRCVILFAALLKLCYSDLASITQNKYSVQHDYMVVDIMNQDYFSAFNLTNTKFNRTTRTFSVVFDLVKPIVSKMTVTYQSHIFKNNQYQRFAPVRFAVSFCAMIDMNFLGFKDIMSQRDMNPGCPIKKGHYKIDNILFDDSRFIPGLPFAKYRLTCTLIDEKVEMIMVSWYGAVIPKKN